MTLTVWYAAARITYTVGTEWVDQRRETPEKGMRSPRDIEFGMKIRDLDGPVE